MLRDYPLFPLRQEHDYKILLCFETGGTSARDASTFENDRIASSIRWCSRWLQKYWLPLVFLNHFLILCPGLHHGETFPLAARIITWWCLEPYLDHCYEPFSSLPLSEVDCKLVAYLLEYLKEKPLKQHHLFSFKFHCLSVLHCSCGSFSLFLAVHSV